MEVISLNSKYRGLEKGLKRTLKKALFYVKKPNKSLEVYLINDSLMKSLNKRFRKFNKVTNVLALPFENFPQISKRFYLGEIYLAPDYIKKRKEDPNYLVIHGLLHLLGYTHRKVSDRIKMEKVEQRILKALKLRS